jgi:basic membrane protein A
MKKILTVLLVLTFVLSSFAFKATMITDVGGLGDKSFNDGTWAGVVRAREELGIDIEIIISTEQTDYVANLQRAAQNSDVVLAVGFLMADALFNVAPQFPNVRFIGIDIGPSEGQTVPTNIALYLFKEQEATFFTGYLAAATTRTEKVGYVGGMEIPPVIRLEMGYRAGVAAYNQIHNTNVQVLRSYAGAFDNPATGKRMAEAQFNQGADIIFHAAGATGNGVIDAAREKGASFYGLSQNAPLTAIIEAFYKNDAGFFAIGVDVDQDYMAPGYVLTSGMKRVDEAAFRGISTARRARGFETGVNILDLAQQGVGMSPMMYTKGLVPNRVFAEMEYLEKLIVEGKLVIPENATQLGTFNVSGIVFPF